MMASRISVPRVKAIHVPAPIGGVNTIAAGVDMPPSDAVYCYNMIGAEFGLRSRLGWYEWCTGLNSEPVTTIAPYTGSVGSGSADRLFAMTQSGIWNVSSSSLSPTHMVTTADGWLNTTTAGWGNAVAFETAAGRFLAYCDEDNGYWIYSESGGSWTKVTYGSGANQITEESGKGYPTLDPGKLVQVCSFKGRLWFVEKDTGRGWYLPVGAISGGGTAGAVPFYFGNHFDAGGDLRGLYRWTGDGGAGFDDRLVAISGGGDLLVFEGYDPSQASTWDLVGVWPIGSVPAGRRLAISSGGDLLVMSSLGILPLSKLVTGTTILAKSEYQTFKVANLFNQLQVSTASTRGWAMALHPQDAALITLVPSAANVATTQLAMSLVTKGWHQYRDIPMGACAAAWGGKLYFGTVDGRVCINDGYLDGLTLTGPGTYADSYTPIGFSLLSAFGNLGLPQLKQVSAITVHVVTQGGGLNLRALARFNWNMTEPDPPTGLGRTVSGSWGSGVWDATTWGGAYQPQKWVFGAAGAGSQVAIAIRGTTSARIALTGFDVGFTLGGLL